MTFTKPLAALTLAAGLATLAAPAMAENGRIGAFVGGALVGSIIANSANGGGYYAPQTYYAPQPYYAPRPYYAQPRVVVREYAPAPGYYYPERRWHHHHDNGWHRGWDD